MKSHKIREAKWLIVGLILVIFGGIYYNIVTTLQEQIKLFLGVVPVVAGALIMGIWLGLIKGKEKK